MVIFKIRLYPEKHKDDANLLKLLRKLPRYHRGFIIKRHLLRVLDKVFNHTQPHPAAHTHPARHPNTVRQDPVEEMNAMIRRFQQSIQSDND